MKSLEELGSFYTSTLLPELQDLEAERRLIQNRLKALACVILGVLAAAWLYRVHDHRQWPAFALAVFLSVPAAAAGYVVTVSGYKDQFRSKVVKKLVAFIDPNLEYVPNFCVEQDVFVGSGFFNKWPDQFGGQDFIGGAIGQTKFQFSEVDAQYETVSEKGEPIPHPLFKGLFYAADFNKPLNGGTFVFPAGVRHLIGEVLGRLIQGRDLGFGERVELEDPEFSRLFVVYSSHPVEARSILNPAMVERLLKYRRMSGEEPWVSFLGRRIHFAIPKVDDYFAPTIFFGPLIDFADVVRYYGRIKMVTRLVDDLHLNTRIWTA